MLWNGSPVNRHVCQGLIILVRTTILLQFAPIIKKCIFGTVKHLNEWGKIAEQDLKELASHFKDVYVDNYIVMPNHIHAIVVLNQENAVDLNSIIGLYKSGVSRKIHKTHPETTVWQRSFHDRIIRNQKEYAYIWQYIQYNDQKWEQDCFYQNTDEI